MAEEIGTVRLGPESGLIYMLKKQRRRKKEDRIAREVAQNLA